MPFTKDHVFPTDEELTVEEVPLGAPYLKAGATYLGKYCEPQNNEFMLCRLETNDPSKCLADGRAVTNCTNEFFRKVSRNISLNSLYHSHPKISLLPALTYECLSIG